MALDPRKFIVKDCAKDITASTSATTKRKEFFNAIGKIGDLEILNDRNTKIAQGLRNLASISNSVRDGVGTPPGILGIGHAIGGSLDAGANWVLDNIGIAASAVQAVQKFNPSIANAAYGQAQQIFQGVKDGTFSENDIPGALQDLQNLDQLAGRIFTPSEGAKEEVVCFASPYAEALAYTYSPKSKFLYIVQFVYNSDFAAFNEIAGKYTAFVARTATRPNIRFDYEEINLYNFRTRIPKRTEYDPMTLTFYDDNQNSSMDFYYWQLFLINPLSRVGQLGSAEYEQSGMEWDSPNWSGSLSPPPGSSQHKNILKRITVYHLHDFGRYMNIFHFYNPKILELQLDELDMASSEIPQVSVQFAYDGLHIEPGVTVDPQSNGGEYNVEDLTNFGKYPIKYNGGKALSTVNEKSTPTDAILTTVS